MRRSSDFTTTVRQGRRARRGCLVMHHRADARAKDAPALIGLIVSRSVGGSVERHRVARRLRHIARNNLVDLSLGSATVVRALAPAAHASSAELDADFRHALRAAAPLVAR
jgi:ribonuclease P protein component